MYNKNTHLILFWIIIEWMEYYSIKCLNQISMFDVQISSPCFFDNKRNLHPTAKYVSIVENKKNRDVKGCQMVVEAEIE